MLTPEDIEKREFLVSLRGYDRDEVAAFLGRVAAQVRELREELDRTRSQLREASTAPAPAPTPEPADATGGGASDVFGDVARETQRILEAAREAAANLQRQARSDVDGELQRARTQATRHIAEGERRREAVERAVGALESRRDELAETLRGVGRTLDETLRELIPSSEPTASVRDALTAEPATAAGEASSWSVPRAQDPIASEGGARARGDRAGGDTGSVGEAVEVVPAPQAPVASGTDEREDDVVAADGAGPDAPRALRAQALSPLHPKVVRQVKRELQELQNLTLDALRRAGGHGEAAAFTPADEAYEQLGAAVEALLVQAHAAGVANAATLAGRPLDAPRRVRPLGEDFQREAATRIDEAVATSLRVALAAGEDLPALTDRVGGVYTELKSTEAEALSSSHLIRAYELGLLDAWAANGVTHRRWVLGREPRCPEARCRHNDHAGVVALHDDFPSGHPAPPVHVGCTCTTVPITEPSA